ncbi:hypothetical protein BS50DRAFT_639304 [Corynespora cassiicola Philippines]|uniref:Uncharacterized protein n=1 Tax=Corynespora cassiicola Philippines TaxID=1448308 RepID=A0A2T2N7S4_CORCC|nr:hypothetical protein BS50DRAFT_639304 [Corynespora cassiicola Philippines]
MSEIVLEKSVTPDDAHHNLNSPDIAMLNIQNIPHPRVYGGFLCLPRELRDEIYELALTSCEQLRLRAPCSDPKSDEGTADEIKGNTKTSFNLLQYVNKQLRDETMGLEFKLNDLTIYRDANHDIEPIQQWSTPSKATLMMRRITVTSDEKCLSLYNHEAPTSMELPQLLYFCRANPHIDVIYMYRNYRINIPHSTKLSFVSIELDNFVTTSVCLKAALRNNTSLPEGYPTYPAYQNLIDKALEWRKNANLDLMLSGVTNFKVLPYENSLTEMETKKIWPNLDEDLKAGRLSGPIKKYCRQWVNQGI